MRQFIYFLVLAFSIILHSCTKENIDLDKKEDRFFLENEKAIMPVVVKGNLNAKVFVIVLHGGPGDSGIKGFSDTNIFQQLESNYALVYYDQRCAGLSQGNCDPTNLQVSDFVEDIDKLVITLEHLYGIDHSLFILGHSWGATLGLDYLINGAYKDKISGFIQSDGSHNIPMLFVEQKELLTYYANQQIALNNNLVEWQSIINKISSADPTIEAGRIKILSSTYETEKLFVEIDSVNSSPFTVSLGKLLNGIASTTVNGIINQGYILSLFDYDITSQLNLITTPTALYWGKFDLVHPPNMAKDIFLNLGTNEKELHFFKNSFHSPMYSENEAYQNKVVEFIEEYR